MLPIKKIVKNFGGAVSKHSPTILTVVAVGGLVATVVLAVRATPKALSLLDQELYERMGDEMFGENGTEITDRLRLFPPVDIVKLTWRCYVPAGICGLATIGCIVGAHGIHLQRTAAIASVYSLTETAFKEYQAKVTETLGRNKELKIRDEIDADHIKKNPPGSNEVIFTGKGELLCYDSWSGRYFKSDIESIRKVENRLNKMLLNEDRVSLNDLYYDLGLPPIKMGDDMFWHVNIGMLDFRFSSQLSENEQPCLVLDHNVKPTVDL